MENTQKELLIVNPFIGETNILNTIKKRAEAGVKVKILTRTPDSRSNDAGKKNDLIQGLQDHGIEVFLKDSIHAKMMVFDRGVAILSSMNLYAHSLAGGSWEAGIATSSSEILNEILNVVNSKIDDKDTKRLGS